MDKYDRRMMTNVLSQGVLCVSWPKAVQQGLGLNGLPYRIDLLPTAYGPLSNCCCLFRTPLQQNSFALFIALGFTHLGPVEAA